MRTVRLVALSDDGKALILAAEDADGQETDRFELPVDDRLRAAARGDARRLGQIAGDSQLPPRAIQARIRAGQTAEQVAAESGTPVERIMRFAHPVLQERARVAEQASEARVRLSEGTLTVNLHQFMSERVRMIGDSADVGWDAHRSDDGTWLVTAAWRTGAAFGSAVWAFDLSARTVAPADAATMDFAEGTRLVRVVPDVPHATAPIAPPPDSESSTAAPAAADPAPNGRPLAALPEGRPERSAGGLAGDEAGDEARAGATGGAHPAATASGIDDGLLDELAEHDTVVLGRTGEDGEDDDPRVHIPAWEDIVFGVRRHR